jgi:hypothetical protein
MEIITIRLGERAKLAAMSANEAAALVTDLADRFTTIASDTIDAIRQTSAPTTRPDSSLPSVTQSSSCKGCGSFVEPGQRYCEVCKEKPQFQAPKGSIEVGAQPSPAYIDANLPPTSR